MRPCELERVSASIAVGADSADIRPAIASSSLSSVSSCRRRQVLFVGIDDEHGKQARGFGLACVCADAMMIAGHLGEAFASAVHLLRSIVDLAPYAPSKTVA